MQWLLDIYKGLPCLCASWWRICKSFKSDFTQCRNCANRHAAAWEEPVVMALWCPTPAIHLSIIIWLPATIVEVVDSGSKTLEQDCKFLSTILLITSNNHPLQTDSIPSVVGHSPGYLRFLILLASWEPWPYWLVGIFVASCRESVVLD